jgi:hypothetical protein
LGAILMAGAAQGVTLADLEGGDTLTSGDGNITFSEFDVTKMKGIDPANVEVVATDHGFTLTSSDFAASSGGLRKLDVSYKVTVTEGTIASAVLDMAGSRESGRIKVEKDIEGEGDDNEAGTFLATLLTGQNSILHDQDNIDPAQGTLLVDTTIRIKKVSSLDSVTDTYDYTGVAEPTTLSLLGSGLAGLVFFGRRRKA